MPRLELFGAKMGIRCGNMQHGPPPVTNELAQCSRANIVGKYARRRRLVWKWNLRRLAFGDIHRKHSTSCPAQAALRRNLNRKGRNPSLLFAVFTEICSFKNARNMPQLKVNKMGRRGRKGRGETRPSFQWRLNSSLKERCPPFWQIDLRYERSGFNRATSSRAQLCLVHITE